ncbi:MAG TPA: hypothetical protein ENI23_08570 [bacterium]|nr:hypothetical protein [bacterium]
MAISKRSQNLMQADQNRKKTPKRKRGGIPIVLFIFTGLLLAFGVLLLVIYLMLDRRIEQTREDEASNAIEELSQTQQVIPRENESDKVYYIWSCELFEYQIVEGESRLISGNVEGFEDVGCFPNHIFAKGYGVLQLTDDAAVIGTYLFDFESDVVILELTLPTSFSLEAFEYDRENKIVYQLVLGEGVYTVDIETLERTRIFEPGGEVLGRGFGPQDSADVELSGDRSKYILQDTFSTAVEPLEEAAEETEEYFSIRIVTMDGEVVDSFNGSFAHWLDLERIVYTKDEGQVVVIRNIITGNEVAILPEANSVVFTDVHLDEGLITVSSLSGDDESGYSIQVYLFDNTTGVETRLDNAPSFSRFYDENLLVGDIRIECNQNLPELDLCGVSPIPLLKDGFAIYDIDAGLLDNIIRN